MSGPAEAAARLRALLHRLGPAWIDPPVLQPAAFYLELLGEEARARAFLVADGAGLELCLRPEMTTAVCRAALTGGAEPPPIAAYEGMVFRRPRPGAEQETEFLQIGAEWFCAGADADILALALEGVRACGVEPRLRLGDAGVFAAFVEGAGLHPLWADRLKRAYGRPGRAAEIIAAAAAPPAARGLALPTAFADLPPDQAAQALDGLFQAGGITPVGGRSAAQIAARLQARAQFDQAPRPTLAQAQLLTDVLTLTGPAPQVLKALAQRAKTAAVAEREGPLAAVARAQALWEAVQAQARPPADSQFCAGLGRTVTYYDGFVFELEAAALGPRASLGGGGRYDALAQRIADETQQGLSAAGFALRPLRLADAARSAQA